MARAGLTEPQITAGIGWVRRTVQAWVRRYDEDGLAGLRDRSGRGRPPILSPEEQPAVAQRLAEGPQAGEVCSLRGVDFQPFVQDQFGKRMSLSAVYDLWHDLGDEWLVPRSKPRKSDPEAIAAFQKQSPQNSRRFKPHIPTNRSSPAFKTSADSVNKGR